MSFRERKLSFHQNAAEEQAADEKAVTLLRSLPYNEKLPSVGLFLKALAAREQELPNLVRAHLGDSMASGRGVRMQELAAGAPELEARRLDQVPALPMGGRLAVDPYADRMELVKSKVVPLLAPSEKMSFEVTPVFPFVTRFNEGSNVVAGMLQSSDGWRIFHPCRWDRVQVRQLNRRPHLR